MDYFGINSADDLPKIKEVLADQIVEPTRIHHTDFEQSESLIVSEGGELLDVQPETEIEEEHVNGHSFEIQAEEGSMNETSETEDLPSEEATEEYIVDETFIEGDEVEETDEVNEEIAEENDSENSPSDETTNNETSDDESSSNEDEEENKPLI